MPHRLDWIVEQRVLYLRNEGIVTGADITELGDELEAEMANAGSSYHVIEDNTEYQDFDDVSLRSIQLALENLDRSRLGWILVVDPDPAVGVGDVMGRAAFFYRGVRYKTFTSLSAAEEFLAREDPSLPNPNRWQVPQSRPVQRAS